MRDSNYPNVKLALSDYSIEFWNSWSNKTGRNWDLVKDLKERDCGIDQVNLALYLHKGVTQFEEIRETIRAYESIGVSVGLVEFDVRCNDYSFDCEVSGDEAWSDEMLEAQADVYGQVVKVCLEEPNCVEISFNELADGWSGSQRLPPQNACLFDKNFQAKPAFDRVVQELAGFDRNHAAVQARLGN